ncbi:MAG: 4Fe-4S binding protein [Treponemataceae bacterium]
MAFLQLYKRQITQCIITLATNFHLTGFITGRIYQGKLKSFCVPGLNCYSCPAAVFSCPIGSLQLALTSGLYVLLYVVGFLLFFASIFARFVCGWLCPFGWLQELSYKLKTPKIPRGFIKKPFRYIKYAILLVFVIVLPIVSFSFLGVASPAFCKFICPAGTFQAGIPLLAFNEDLRDSIGSLFLLKFTILVFFATFMIIEYRAFCKFACPLGAFYSFFNKIALVGIKVDKDKCTNCKACVKECKMNCNEINDLECIRCGECKSKCMSNAII